MRTIKTIIHACAMGVALCAIVACSSDGDSGGGGGGPAAATVSGTASSPGGLLAKAAPTKLQRFFAALLPTDAWAQAIGGFAPVPNANVFLVRITNAGVPTGTPLILAQTTTNAAGQYTLTLPPGVTPASDLIVQVTNAATPQPIPTAGTQNAPATQATVNVDPVSEEVLQEVIAFLGANPANTLADFSAFELSELQRVINAAVAANPSLVGATAAQTIANIQTSLAPALATTIPVLASSTNFLTVLSTSLPNGQANVAYNQPILAIGNPGALSYAVVGGLPSGLSLNSTTGQITGTPTAAGTFNFSIQVSLPTAPPSPVTRALSITLAPPAPAAVASLTPTPQTIQVNTQGSLTVTLNVAQLTDTTVTLSAVPGGIVTLPAGNSVQVLANQLSASFTISAGAVAGATRVTATIGTSSASADVTVSLTPPPSGWVTLGTPVVTGQPVRLGGLAVAPNGRVGVAYVVGSSGTAGLVGELRVSEWDGTSWTPLGGALNLTAADGPSLATRSITYDSASTPVVAWLDRLAPARPLVVQRWNRNSSTWERLGDPQYSTGAVTNDPQIAIDPTNNRPIVVITGGVHVTVREWTGTDWSPAGAQLTTSLSNAILAVSNGGQRLLAHTFDAAQIGPPPPPGTPTRSLARLLAPTAAGQYTIEVTGPVIPTSLPGSVLFMDFALASDGPFTRPFVLTGDLSVGPMALREWTGSAWESIGGDPGLGDFRGRAQLRVTPLGLPLIAYRQGSASPGRVEGKWFDGMAWQSVASPNAASVDVTGFALGLVGDGLPYVALTQRNPTSTSPLADELVVRHFPSGLRR